MSQNNSSSVVKDGSVRYGGPWFDLCMVKIFQHCFVVSFFNIFVIAILEYLNPKILHLFGFCFITL